MDMLTESVGIANKQYSSLIVRVVLILLDLALKISFIKEHWIQTKCILEFSVYIKVSRHLEI